MPSIALPNGSIWESITAVSEALVQVRIPLLLFWLKVSLMCCRWSQIAYSQSEHLPEVIIPLKITDSGTGMKSFDWISYSLKLEGQRYVVHLKVIKHLLARHMPVFTYTDQGALRKDYPFIQNNCYYYGYVEGDPKSQVSINSCFGGFHGILQIDTTIYKIEPKMHSTTFEHVVYKLKSEEKELQSKKCGLTDDEIQHQLKVLKNANLSTSAQSSNMGWWTHKQYLELGIVVDKNRYLHHSSNATEVQFEVSLIVNVVKFIFEPLNIDLSLKGIEIWTQENFVATDTMEGLLENFCIWKRLHFNDRLPHDIAHFFVKASYGDTVGLAYVGTVCNDLYNCGVSSFMNDDIIEVGNVMSHELGHNLGMGHDEQDCACGQPYCIMHPSKVDATRFSNCSYSQYLRTCAGTDCLKHPLILEKTSKEKHCGNGVVEKGEDCDCGSIHSCAKDPCCETNCTLKRGALCAVGLCCKNCKILPAGTLCRKEENECDLPEWCNGKTSRCPEDVYVQGGIPCKGGGYCYEKRCNNRDAQCRSIFGKEAKSATLSCYRDVNIQGDRFGHCSLNSTTYTQCQLKDSMCGRIQCENVREIPLLQHHRTLISTNISGHSCWSTDYHVGMTIPDVGDVKDGMECGENYICLKRKCVPMPDFKRYCSPVTCNMNGICNNRNHCHCNAQRRPPYCHVEGFGGSVDSGPAPRKHSSNKQNTELFHYWFLMTGLRFFIFILIFLFIIAKSNSED
ncbi:disintegrin and metalloproteinase domain-containing protein 20-like [Sorex fumeus]|uniref:disintegrin and metalloproteinase domain-containing protein 20-like n=1 Tax=Sorex fumeus TaxID=62283 RepID=UPI0024AD743A|nr:disintegrin and metalloproteinase domain-containing protein 20-like [Sorex fumeus]